MALHRFNDHSPIFVVGSARSGTTLLQLMLNAHSEISLAGELHFFDQILKLKKVVPDLATSAQIDALFSLIPRLPAFRYLKGIEEVLESTRRIMKEFPEGDYETLYLHLMKTSAAARGARRFGEKLTTLRYLDELVEIFPDCKMVHIVRDPRACVASRIRTPWTSGDVMTNALKWKIDLASARSFRQRRDPAGQRFCEIKYEDLVHEPTAALQSICTFLGEPYQASMLAYDRSAGEFIKDEPWKSGVSRPVYASSVELWRSTLSEAQLFLIETTVRREMAWSEYPRARVRLKTVAAVPFQVVAELYRWLRFKLHEHRERKRSPYMIDIRSDRLYRLLWRSLNQG
jgi:Sulfotransferase family